MCVCVCDFQVFLQHLSPLLSLPTFAALWLTILDFMDKYMHAGSSDLLVRIIATSLLNDTEHNVKLGCVAKIQ